MRKLNLIRTTNRSGLMYHLHAPEYRMNLTLPALVDLRPLDVPIFDQGELGSCTSMGWGDLADFLQMKQLRAHVPFGQSPEIFAENYSPVSRLFIYINELIEQGTLGQDAGASIDQGGRVFQKYGICREAIMPYSDDPSVLSVRPSPEAYAEAANHRISGAYQVMSLMDMKQSLAHGFPVVIGIMVYDSMMGDAVASSGQVPYPNLGAESCQGGHCVVVVGYDDLRKVLIVRNSWGTDWGMKGYFTLPYAFATDPNLMDDARTIRL